jgi:hypothetical protein
MRRLLALVVALIVSGALPGAAQETSLQASLQPLAFLIGEWDGTGWIRTGPGEPATFHQHEVVRAAAGGSVLIIDGLGRSTVPGQDGRIVHQAFAVVSYDSAGSRFRWRAYRAGGDELDVVPEVGRDRLTWGFPSPGGSIRFTIDRTAGGDWHEIGEFVRAGAPDTKFFEMTLQRVKR